MKLILIIYWTPMHWVLPIRIVKNQWIFFDLAISQLNQANRGDGKAAQHVATSSERIAQVLDEASAQYARDYSAGLRAAR